MSTLTEAGAAFALHRNPAPASDAVRAKALSELKFGTVFTDHMAHVTWTHDAGWADRRVEPYGPLSLDPAAAVLHYGQEIFEGLKAYRHPDDTIWLFRPDANAARMQASAARLALPELSHDDFLGSIDALIGVDHPWVPSGDETSLYLRPFMFASEAFLGVRPAHQISYLVIASPVGSYFSGGIKPVSIWLSSTYTRAAVGGTGAAKCGGNYASSLAAQLEAGEHGCDQVCFLDAVERKWVEELGGMNLYFVHRDGRLVTPELTGTILEGVTRSSILVLAKEQGLEVEERRVDIDEWRRGVDSGEITEVFACGTAAVITPVGRLVWDGGEVTAAEGEVTMRLRKALVDIQYGRSTDAHGWLRQLA